jgi:hypothetical protein
MHEDQQIIAQFSKHLFWDVNPDNLRLEQHKKQIVQRVLEYGMLEDWILLRKTYGLKDITDTAKTLRSLESTAMTFIASLSSIPITAFRCYTWRQLTKTHWPY